jgi:hypothetical protein
VANVNDVMNLEDAGAATPDRAPMAVTEADGSALRTIPLPGFRSDIEDKGSALGDDPVVAGVAGESPSCIAGQDGSRARLATSDARGGDQDVVVDDHVQRCSINVDLVGFTEFGDTRFEDVDERVEPSMRDWQPPYRVDRRGLLIGFT